MSFWLSALLTSSQVLYELLALVFCRGGGEILLLVYYVPLKFMLCIT